MQHNKYLKRNSNRCKARVDVALICGTHLVCVLVWNEEVEIEKGSCNAKNTRIEETGKIFKNIGRTYTDMSYYLWLIWGKRKKVEEKEKENKKMKTKKKNHASYVITFFYINWKNNHIKLKTKTKNIYI